MNGNLPSYLMDDILSVRSHLSPREQLHYVDFAIESITNADKASYLNTLYTNFISKSNIDFGDIPNTKGDITKLKDYGVLSEAIGKINALCEGRNLEEIDLLNALFDMAVSQRADYAYGFKFEIQIIMITYNTTVSTIFDLLNLCIVRYAHLLRDANEINLTIGRYKSKDLYMVKSAKTLVKLYESGEWQKMMKSIKGNSNNLFGKNFINTAVNALDFVAKDPEGARSNAVQNITASPIFKGTATVAGIFATITALIFAVRGLIYAYYAHYTKKVDQAKINKQFLELNLERNPNMSEDAAKKQREKIQTLQNMVDHIEIDILKTQKSVEEMEKKDDAEILNKSNVEKHSAVELEKTFNVF